MSLVVAVAENGVIGRDNGLPWHLPVDLQHFRRITMGNPLLMGRLTHQAIGKPLPGRRNIVLSRDPSFAATGCEVVGALQVALGLVDSDAELMVIGGEQLYRQALPLAQRIYLTRVKASPAGDAYFPKLRNAEWETLRSEEHVADERNEYDCSFLWLQRQPSPV